MREGMNYDYSDNLKHLNLWNLKNLNYQFRARKKKKLQLNNQFLLIFFHTRLTFSSIKIYLL